MKSISRSIRYQLKEDKDFSVRFWIIMFFIGVLAYLVNSRTNSGIGMINTVFENGVHKQYVSVAGSNILVLFIMLVIYTYNNYYERLPLSLSFSITRKNFIKSLIVSNLVVTFVFSVIQGIALKIDPLIIKNLGLNPIYEYFYINTNTDSLVFIIFSTFLISLVFMSIWNVIASLNYKFGAKLWLVFLGIGMFLSVSNFPGIKYLMITEYFEIIVTQKIGLLQIIIYPILISIFYIVTYFVIKTINIKYKSN